MDADLIVIGAGPAGLSLACAVADAGLRTILVERQPRAELEAPDYDGRDIALTHRAIDILGRLGIWAELDDAEVSPLRQARVTNGDSPFALAFSPDAAGRDRLGVLVPNHEIRRAAFAQAMGRPQVTLADGLEVVGQQAAETFGEVTLSDGRRLRAPLVVAADSRFSTSRRRLGIGARMLDFGRTVVVARLSHDRPNEGIAHECFRHGDTLAILPLNRDRVSAVITVPADRADALMRLPAAAFADTVRTRFGDRLGAMRLDSLRHAYPLVAVYADRFVASRFALVGDAAVGMHPVTAHGFNFGLYGVETLARHVARAWQRRGDPGAPDALAQFQHEHRVATLPIYLGTNALVRLYTDDRVPARLARDALLRVADRLSPLKRRITRQLTGVPDAAPAAAGAGLSP